MTLQTYLQYHDSQIFHWRKGTPNDPYVPRQDSLPVINGIITLLEIPSETHKVKIAGLSEVSLVAYQHIRELATDQFLVNYSNGVIQFHPSQEGKAFLCEYHGRGLILQPASRVYAMVRRSPNVVKTLQDIIDEVLLRLEENQESISILQQVIQSAIDATHETNIATDNVNRARDDTIVATENAQQATQEALDAAASTIMIYQNPVPTYEDISITYPNPDNGWRVMVKETGDIYRFDGVITNSWIWVDNYTGGSIPFATETTSGLLHTEDFKKFIVRRLLIGMTSVPQAGIQNYIAQFPFDGEIIDAKGYCIVTGHLAPIEMSVEKVSSEGFEQGASWESIFSTNITISAGQYIGSNPTISNTSIDAGDYFRINVLQLDNNFKAVTVQLDIKTKI